MKELHNMQSQQERENYKEELERVKEIEELLSLLQADSLLENVMEDNKSERPDKRRKLENDKGDGVIPAPGRSPRVVLSKIKLKEGVIERLRRIKKRAHEQVNQSTLSTTDIPKNDGTRDIPEQSTGKDFDNLNIDKLGDEESDRNNKRKRDNEEREEQNIHTAKITKIDSDIVNQETPNLLREIDKKERSEAKPTCEKALGVPVFNESKDVLKELQSSASALTSSKDESVPKVSESTRKCSDALATQNKGDEVIKAAQNYAKSGAQTEPKQGQLLTDDKLVVVVTEVLEEGDTKPDDSVELEKQNNLDNNDHGEREEKLSDKDEAGDQDYMTDAIYQLIKDVIKKRTEIFESALLRENEKLEKRVLQLEKQNALLQRVGYQLDSAVKEIIKKREQASQSRISRGTQVNMNLLLSRTSPMKSTTIHLDVPETGKDHEKSPQLISNSTLSQEKNRSPSANNGLQSISTSRQSPSKHPTLSSGSGNVTVTPSTSDKTWAVPKPGENNSSKTRAIGTKTPSESESTSKPIAKEPLKVSSGQQQELSSHKTVPPGMGHFRLSPSYKRNAQQQSPSEDKSETGHYRITPAGLEHHSRFSNARLMQGTSVVNEIGQMVRPTRPFPTSPRSQKMDTSTPTSASQNKSTPAGLEHHSRLSSARLMQGTSVVNEIGHTDRPTRPFPTSPRSQKMDGTSTPTSASQNKSNLSSLPVSSATMVRQSQLTPLSKAVTQIERSQSVSVSSSSTTLKYTNVNTLERTRIQNKTTSSTVSSVTTTSSPTQQRLYTKETSSQSVLNKKLDSSQCKGKEYLKDEEPEVVIVSQTNNSSPKGQAKLSSRSEKPAGYVEVSAAAPPVQTNNGIQAQVRIQRSENRAVEQQRSQPQSQRTVKSSNQHIEQRPQALNHLASSQQTVYRTHDMSQVSKAPRDNVPPIRPNEPQQNIHYIIRKDHSRPNVVEDQVRTDKVPQDPRQPPRYVIQNSRGQPLLVREQPPRYVIQDDPPRVVHEHPTRTIVHGVPGQSCQPIPQQPTLPPGAAIVQQHHRGIPGSSNANKAPAPTLIGIQDVRTQPPQPYPTQQQQHIVVKQHQPIQNSQHSYQHQQTSYQYQQPQHRPTVAHQQNAPQSQVPAYCQPRNVQQAAPRSTNVQRSAPAAPYQPRPMGPAQENFPSSRIPAERSTGKHIVAVGGHSSQPTPDVVYRPGTLEATNIRPAAPTSLPPGYDRYQPRPEYIQQAQGRQPQVVNQGVPKPPNLVERSISRPSSQGGTRYVQNIEQQRIQDRRPQGPNPPEQTQPSPPVDGKDSGPQQPSPPKPTASIAIVEHGIVLSWNITTGESTENIDCYELFACQDDSNSTLPPILWKKIGVVKALPLPMACTLTQFSSGSRYQFAVRAVDTSERAGPFSDPCVITLKR